MLASKVKCEATTPRDELMTRLEGSLRRLRTDRIDVYFNHAVNELDRLKNPEWLEFTKLTENQGLPIDLCDCSEGAADPEVDAIGTLAARLTR